MSDQSPSPWNMMGDFDHETLARNWETIDRLDGRPFTPVSLLEIVKFQLKSRGYEEVESNPNGGGVWTHPDWDEATDHILQAIEDCFERESQ